MKKCFIFKITQKEQKSSFLRIWADIARVSIVTLWSVELFLIGQVFIKAPPIIITLPESQFAWKGPGLVVYTPLTSGKRWKDSQLHQSACIVLAQSLSQDEDNRRNTAAAASYGQHCIWEGPQLLLAKLRMPMGRIGIQCQQRKAKESLHMEISEFKLR